MAKIPFTQSGSRYLEIAQFLRDDIAAGRYTDRIPGERTLAAKYRVNFKTANRAIGQLIEEGSLFYLRGKGAFIQPRRALKNLVGLFMRSTGHVFEPMVEELVSSLQRGGMLSILQNTSDEEFSKQATENLERVLRQEPQALVLHGERGLFECLPLRKIIDRVPNLIFVRDFESPDESPSTFVLSDAYRGTFLGTDYLASLGHQRIAFVIYSWKWGEEAHRASTHRLQCRGYLDAMEKNGLSPFILEEVHDQVRRDADWIRMLEGENRPTAIFALGDARLVRVWPLFKKLGFSIPGDLALLGHDNTPWCDFTEVKLSSISIREKEIAGIAARKVLDERGSPERILVQPELILRESTGKARSAEPLPRFP